MHLVWAVSVGLVKSHLYVPLYLEVVSSALHFPGSTEKMYAHFKGQKALKSITNIHYDPSLLSCAQTSANKKETFLLGRPFKAGFTENSIKWVLYLKYKPPNTFSHLVLFIKTTS